VWHMLQRVLERMADSPRLPSRAGDTSKVKLEQQQKHAASIHTSDFDVFRRADSRPRLRDREADFLDRLARVSDRIWPYSTTAFAIAIAAVMIAGQDIVAGQTSLPEVVVLSENSIRLELA
jgi:hypothetical protein